MLDVRGSLKNTKLSSNPYVVFDELLSNSIDSYLIRKHEEPGAEPLEVHFKVEFWDIDLLGAEAHDCQITCSDNGCGIGEDQALAFLTKDTSYKDDLDVIGIGKCKGAGRIQYFHHFSRVNVSSIFQEDGSFRERTLEFHEDQKQISPDMFSASPSNATRSGTVITLSDLKETARNRKFLAQDLSEIFSASSLKKTVLVSFLQRLIGLEEQIGDFKITFETKVGKDGNPAKASLKKSDLPSVSEVRSVMVKERDPLTGEKTQTEQQFTVSHYKLDKNAYDLPKNAIAFCAKSSPVKDITKRYLRTKTEQNNPVGKFHHIVLIEGDFLDNRVNEQRDDFDDLPEELEGGDLVSGAPISYQDIYDVIDDVIAEFVTPPDWNKEKVMDSAARHFGISEAMLADTGTRVRYGDTAHSVVDRVLKKYQERVVVETENIVDLKDEILNLEPDSEDFRQKINDLSWMYTASLKNFDMANLSQLVVRRAAIVEVLSLAHRKQLNFQAPDVEGRRKDEKIIHSVFFPMKKDSKEVADHDIWLLNEEYHYYEYISSDKPLAQIEWEDGSALFDPEIDVAFEKILAKRTDDNSKLRPDIALFSEEGSAIIIEFKAPGVSMDDHIGDLSEYAHILAAKSKGRIKKFYGYIIGDTLNPLRIAGWTRFPTGKGYFRTSPLEDPESSQNLGELYQEVLFYEDVVDRAKKRIGVYKEKLGIDLSVTQ
ncbi:hypothetical protein [Thalassospira povalilytica]|uniref:ATP-binding protein n=1 Tax=Thalassospira povalilytica TaxID=732237 RepID=A0ABX4R804_9PROT|nr:hypothetical protein [Thalassospira povalilytica]PKR49828.1 hypothetical protein CU041_08795 [Thalassospira povalilytica]